MHRSYGQLQGYLHKQADFNLLEKVKGAGNAVERGFKGVHEDIMADAKTDREKVLDYRGNVDWKEWAKLMGKAFLPVAALALAGAGGYGIARMTQKRRRKEEEPEEKTAGRVGEAVSIFRDAPKYMERPSLSLRTGLALDKLTEKKDKYRKDLTARDPETYSEVAAHIGPSRAREEMEAWEESEGVLPPDAQRSLIAALNKLEQQEEASLEDYSNLIRSHYLGKTAAARQHPVSGDPVSEDDQSTKIKRILSTRLEQAMSKQAAEGDFEYNYDTGNLVIDDTGFKKRRQERMARMQSEILDAPRKPLVEPSTTSLSDILQMMFRERTAQPPPLVDHSPALEQSRRAYEAKLRGQRPPIHKGMPTAEMIARGKAAVKLQMATSDRLRREGRIKPSTTRRVQAPNEGTKEIGFP
jgi:acyl-CoA-binding protein